MTAWKSRTGSLLCRVWSHLMLGSESAGCTGTGGRDHSYFLPGQAACPRDPISDDHPALGLG